MTRDEINKLLGDGNVFEMLSWKQLIKLMWWENFNSRRTDKFLDSLKRGKHAMAAFKDAQKIK